MTALWPCSTCGAPGVRNLGTRGYCGAHLAELYRKLDPSVFAANGIGLQAGPRRPDHGPEYVELECIACGATWVGALFERCSWCADAARRMAEWQAEYVLTPPDVDRDDRNYRTRMVAWADRLTVAVNAGIVTRERALAVWYREVGDDDHASA